MKNKIFLLAVLGLICFGALMSFWNRVDVCAAEKPSFTIKKGKSEKVYNIIKSNPLTKDKKTLYKNLKWKSTKKEIVKIISDKKIKGIKSGTAYIRGYNNKNKKCLAIKITVGKRVSSIKPTSTKVTMDVGAKVKLSVKVLPSSASNKDVFYVCSNPSVATVSKYGKITGVSSGNATITIYSKDGNAKKKISVKVQSPILRTTTKGKVKGIETNNGRSLIWYGVPYGASTAGNNRWREPKAVQAWTGTKSATTQKAGAAQYSDGTSYIGTEDCLYVNIYRPNNGEANLPVMVFLHGGGNASGTANVSFSSMALASNCIVVSVEYRLGAFGYLSHKALRDGTPEENSGNFTLLDIKAALQWVRGDIKNFGGNPSNVTLSGFSAGARNVMLCLISPSMKGLFQKAIVFSGGANTCTNEAGEESVDTKLANILVNRGTFTDKKSALQYIQYASNDTIRQLFNGLTTTEVANIYKSSGLRLSEFPQGFNDGVVIPKEGFSVIRSGDYNRVPVILGSDATEFSSFAWSGSVDSNLKNVTEITSTEQMNDIVAKAIQYGSQLQSSHYIEKSAEMLFQDANHSPVYAYRFKWGTDSTVTDDFYSKYVGAYHGASKDFLRGVYKNKYPGFSPNAMGEANKPGRVALTALMQKYVGNFLLNGNPNGTSVAKWNTWNNIEGSNKIMIFNANSKSNTSGMSSEYLGSDQTITEMKNVLSEFEYNIMFTKLYKDRFFLPESVPSYN